MGVRGIPVGSPFRTPKEVKNGSSPDLARLRLFANAASTTSRCPDPIWKSEHEPDIETVETVGC